jgi:hypothetical protein
LEDLAGARVLDANPGLVRLVDPDVEAGPQHRFDSIDAVVRGKLGFDGLLEDRR